MTAGDVLSQRQPDPRPVRGSVAAVIVTYHPSAGLIGRFADLEGQVAAVVIVDNGSRPTELGEVWKLAASGSADVIRNTENLGVGAALNQGVAWVASKGYAWALTFDQDTAPGPGVVNEAAHVLAARGDRPVAVIGAGRQDLAAKDTPRGNRVAYVITAGALHSVEAWQRLGGFRDDFFIDYVDIEYCLRARAAGYEVLLSRIQTIAHSIGQPSRHRTKVRGFTTSNHDRARRYYITRNRIIVWRTYLRSERRFVASDMEVAAKELVKLALFESDRGGKIRAILRGMRDGMRRVTGEERRR